MHARRGNYFSKLISYASILGMALGMAVLLTILSIMNGFESEIRDRVLGLDGHLEIEVIGASNEERVELIELLKDAEREIEVWATISRDVLVQVGHAISAIELRSSNIHEPSVQTRLMAYLNEGAPLSSSSEPFSIVVGSGLAAQLGVGVGDFITLISPDPKITGLGLSPRTKRFKVEGIFEVGLDSSDRQLAFIRYRDATRFLSLDGLVDRLEVRLVDATEVSTFVASINDIVRYPIRDWTQLHSGLFQALKTEKFLMFILLAVAMAIALFNLVSILMVSIDDKRKDMKILFSMGLSRGSIVGIFLIQGVVTSMAGVTLGVVLGYFLASNISEVVLFLETMLQFKIFPPEVFYISEIPSVLMMSDFLMVTIVASILGIVTPFYPAWRVAKLSRVWRESV